MNKREFVRKHEQKLAMAFIYFWSKIEKELTKEKIEEIKAKGYIPSELEEEYKKLLDSYLFPILLYSLEEGEKEVKENFSILFDLEEVDKESLTKIEIETKAKYFYNAQKQATESILNDLNIKDDKLHDELIKMSVGLSKKDTDALLKYNEKLKDGGATENVRKKQIIRYSRKKRRERAKAIGRTETSQGYSKMVRQTVKIAQRKYNWQMTKTWITSNDSRVCEICRGLAGMTLEMDEFFPAYGGIIGPEESHTRCRCDLQYHKVDEI